MLLRWLIYFFLLCFIQCSPKKPGIFSFHQLTDSVLNPLQKKWFYPTSFTIPRKPVFFYSNRILWYCYHIKKISLTSTPNYVVVLRKKNLNWAEFHARQYKLKRNYPYLIGKYHVLPPGQYSIQIMQDRKIIDKLEFMVISHEVD